jgi:hypothetical protein
MRHIAHLSRAVIQHNVVYDALILSGFYERIHPHHVLGIIESR